MKIRLSFAVKVPRQEFKVNRSFKTKSVITKRTLDVAEAFGIGVDEEKEFVIFKDFSVNVNPGDIVYITGDSGGGKSILLRQLALELTSHKEFGRIVSIEDLQINGEDVLIESVGRDTTDAISKLSMAGLNEAFLFLRRYEELSEGQKYRFKIAKLLDEDADTWIADEFLALLDRTTARVVAYCFQKTARQHGKTVLVATSHEDLFEDLQPSVYIRKVFGGIQPDVEYRSYSPAPCSVLNKIQILPASKHDYLTLDKFHYRASLPGVAVRIFKAVLRDGVVGVILYSNSPLRCGARRIHLGYTPTYQEINRSFAIISRVVVHPKYRSISLGAKLVRDTMPLVGRKYIETIAVMARYNPFFAKAGMTEVPYNSDYRTDCLTVVKKLEPFGFTRELSASETASSKLLEKLNHNDLEGIRDIVIHSGLRALQQYKNRSNQKLSKLEYFSDKRVLAHTISQIAVGSQAKKYYFWRNPRL